MNSGLSKKEEFASLSLYENKSYLNTWGEGNNYCNSIESVVLFPPFVNKDKAVNVFIEDICRSVIYKHITRDFYKKILYLIFILFLFQNYNNGLHWRRYSTRYKRLYV